MRHRVQLEQNQTNTTGKGKNLSSPWTVRPLFLYCPQYSEACLYIRTPKADRPADRHWPERQSEGWKTCVQGPHQALYDWLFSQAGRVREFFSFSLYSFHDQAMTIPTKPLTGVNQRWPPAGSSRAGWGIYQSLSFKQDTPWADLVHRGNPNRRFTNSCPGV